MGEFELVAAPGWRSRASPRRRWQRARCGSCTMAAAPRRATECMVSDGTLSDGPRAASIIFSVPAVVPVPCRWSCRRRHRPPPAVSHRPAGHASTERRAPAGSAAQPPAVAQREVVFSPGRPMASRDGWATIGPGAAGSSASGGAGHRAQGHLNPAPSVQAAELSLLIQGSRAHLHGVWPPAPCPAGARTAPSPTRATARRARPDPGDHGVGGNGRHGAVGGRGVVGEPGGRAAGQPAGLDAGVAPYRSAAHRGRDEDEEEQWAEPEDRSDADADELAVSMVLGRLAAQHAARRPWDGEWRHDGRDDAHRSETAGVAEARAGVAHQPGAGVAGLVACCCWPTWCSA